MSARATIDVNGAERPLEEPTLDALLRSLGYGEGEAGIAVAVNGEVVRRTAWAERRLRAGDHVEIVGATQGG